MVWYAYTVALAVPEPDVQVNFDPQGSWPKGTEATRFVYSYSRNGAVINTLKTVCEQSSINSDLYLFGKPRVLLKPEIEMSAASISALLLEIEHQPQLVVEATKLPHQPSTEVLAKGFLPLPVEVIYPSTATIKNGWVYTHTAEEVRSLLRNAATSQNPRPVHDDEGESLEYAFGLLKSHLWLLRFAAENDLVVVYQRGDA